MSKDVHTLISEACEYVVTHGKRKFRLHMELCYQATLLMIKLTLDSYTTSGRTRAINEGLLTATIILGSFECRDSYRSGPSRSVGTTEVLHVELVQEILALVGHVAFKLERLLHLPLRVFFPHT